MNLNKENKKKENTMKDYWNDPPEDYEPPECCGEIMAIDSVTGVCSCKCGKRIEPEKDGPPEPDIELPDCYLKEDNMKINNEQNDCTSCGSEKNVDVRYSFGVYAGRLCLDCCRKFRDNCGIGQPEGDYRELDEPYWED